MWQRSSFGFASALQTQPLTTSLRPSTRRRHEASQLVGNALDLRVRAPTRWRMQACTVSIVPRRSAGSQKGLSKKKLWWGRPSSALSCAPSIWGGAVLPCATSTFVRTDASPKKLTLRGAPCGFKNSTMPRCKIPAQVGQLCLYGSINQPACAHANCDVRLPAPPSAFKSALRRPRSRPSARGVTSR